MKAQAPTPHGTKAHRLHNDAESSTPLYRAVLNSRKPGVAGPTTRELSGNFEPHSNGGNASWNMGFGQRGGDNTSMTTSSGAA